MKPDALPSINLPSSLLRSKIDQKNLVEADRHTEEIDKNIDSVKRLRTVDLNNKQNIVDNNVNLANKNVGLVIQSIDVDMNKINVDEHQNMIEKNTNTLDNNADFVKPLTEVDVKKSNNNNNKQDQSVSFEHQNVIEENTNALDKNSDFVKPLTVVDIEKSNNNNMQNQLASFEPEKFVPLTEYFILADKLSESEERAKKLEKEIIILRKKMQKAHISKVQLLKRLDAKDRIIYIKERQIENYINTFKSVFTPTQIKLLLKPGQTKAHWQAEDVASAMSLRAISPQAYEFLRTKMRYPLPSFSTLKNWTSKQSKLNVTPGLSVSGSSQATSRSAAISGTNGRSIQWNTKQ